MKKDEKTEQCSESISEESTNVQCHNCGNCCDFTRWRPILTKADEHRIQADDGGMPFEAFVTSFVIPVYSETHGETGYSFVTHKEYRAAHPGTLFPDDDHCIFRNAERCSIYHVRPDGCRAYPEKVRDDTPIVCSPRYVPERRTGPAAYGTIHPPNLDLRCPECGSCTSLSYPGYCPNCKAYINEEE